MDRGRTALAASAALAGLLAGIAIATPRSAEAATLGADLNRPVTANYDCTWRPPFGFPGTPSCTYVGTPAPPITDESTATPFPGGVITRARVKARAPLGPLRVTVLRAIASSTSGFACCFFQAQSDVFTPQRDGVTSVPVRLPVQNFIDTRNGQQVVDYLAITVLQPNTRIPAHDTGNTNGPEFSGAFYPHVSPADASSGRVDSNGTGGVLPLLNAEFTPLCGSGASSRSPARPRAFADNEQGLRAPPRAEASAGRCLGGASARNGSLSGSNAKVPVDCNLTTRCSGKLQLRAKRGKAKLGDSRFKVASGDRKKVKVKLNKKGKRQAKGKRKLTVKAKVKVTGGPNKTTKIKLKR